MDAGGEGIAAAAAVLLLAGSERTAEAMRQAAARRLVAITARHGADLAGMLREALAAPPAVIALVRDRDGDAEALRLALGAARAAGRLVVLLPAIAGETALLAAEGAIPVASHRELLDTALFLASLARTGLPGGRRVAILTGGGGGGVIAADLCGAAGLDVPPLSAATRAALAPLVPPIASTGNPVDLTPEAFTEKTYDRFPRILDIVAADPGVDALFLPTTFNAPRGDAVAAQVLAAFHARSPKPVLIGAGTPPEMLPVFAAAGVAPIADPAGAAATLAKLALRAALPAPPRRAPCVARSWDAATLPARLREAGFELEPGAGAGAALPLALRGWRDPDGAAIALGAGGVQGRVLEDRIVAPAPVEAAHVPAWLDRSRVFAHALRLDGALDRAAFARAVAGFSQLVASAPWPRFRLRLDPVLPGAVPRVSALRLEED
jgi:acyl-CoA synthetase (NDP forming)